MGKGKAKGWTPQASQRVQSVVDSKPQPTPQQIHLKSVAMSGAAKGKKK